jgi:hypothetical protein
VSVAAITLCIASQRVFIVVVYFVMDSVRKHLGTPSYIYIYMYVCVCVYVCYIYVRMYVCIYVCMQNTVKFFIYLYTLHLYEYNFL